MNEEIPYNPPGMDEYIREGARKNQAWLRKRGLLPEGAQTESAKADSVQRVVSRREFERWAKEPPREWPLRICPESGAWPGQYMPYYVQCAWEAWCEAANK